MEPRDLRYRRKMQAQEDFPEAAKLAAAAGMNLVAINEATYQLDGPRRAGQLKINPSRRHIRNVGWPTVDGFDRDAFSLIDVVQAAVEAIERK